MSTIQREIPYHLKAFLAKTTTIYAKVTKENKARAADALPKAYRGSRQNRETCASWRRVPVISGLKDQSVAGS